MSKNRKRPQTAKSYAKQALAQMSRVQSPRASTIPNKKREASRKACRGPVTA